MPKPLLQIAPMTCLAWLACEDGTVLGPHDLISVELAAMPDAEARFGFILHFATVWNHTGRTVHVIGAAIHIADTVRPTPLDQTLTPTDSLDLTYTIRAAAWTNGKTIFLEKSETGQPFVRLVARLLGRGNA
jgi:hypothetical protein